jgi:hypothetical protein
MFLIGLLTRYNKIETAPKSTVSRTPEMQWRGLTHGESRPGDDEGSPRHCGHPHHFAPAQIVP